MKIGVGPKQRTLFLWLARLALFAYAFQVSAADHWHQDTTNLGGHALHQMHCHSDISSCAEQPNFSGSLAEIKLAPIPPHTAIETTITSSVSIPSAAYIASADEPPRATV